MVGVYLLPGTGGPAIKFSLGPKRSPLSDQPSLFLCDPAQTRLLPRQSQSLLRRQKVVEEGGGEIKDFSSLLYLKMSAGKKERRREAFFSHFSPQLQKKRRRDNERFRHKKEEGEKTS